MASQKLRWLKPGDASERHRRWTFVRIEIPSARFMLAESRPRSWMSIPAFAWNMYLMRSPPRMHNQDLDDAVHSLRSETGRISTQPHAPRGVGGAWRRVEYYLEGGHTGPPVGVVNALQTPPLVSTWIAGLVL